MSDDRTIDILLPYYSPSERAWPTIESVLAQTDPRWRLVVVDDAYPEDLIRARLESLGDPRVEYVRNPENIGLARNFSRCLELARSEHFVMLGDDDLMHPRYVESISARLAAQPEVDIVQPGVRVIDDEGKQVLPLGDRIKAVLRPRGGSDGVTLCGVRMAESLMRADWAYFPSLAWRTSTARAHGFREEYAVALDYGLLLDIALDGGTMLVYDDVVFDYRRHRASVSSTTASSGVRFAQEREFAWAFAARMAERGWNRAARIGRRRAISRLHAVSEAVGALLAGDVGRSRVLLSSARR
ncbi:glycosyltransferase involved in cell wall biosynthesis [Microbacterium natoriense]|uniref:Glycosyltransferase involved in cell wall biosynthesis n=1 Tax=Microbacterium natoriense TaxID=284570 RepID=A0AAW8EXN8_9MICO|nr:glycosyltransferase family 2 protein [Microbacterium natoriense]MDQ0647757.1 glycosyltransferase involved in cell wall biosynthesis [Microbacterium natoriense]